VCVIAKDVAIHYRCGDNIHSSGMGLLRFAVIAERVPSSARLVYVMSEDHKRKTVSDEAFFCSFVLSSLFDYLVQTFPDKTIVMLRGAKLFDDMTRMALAPVTIASMSSFSLFACITNKHRVYYPASALFDHQQVMKRGNATSQLCIMLGGLANNVRVV
jgi:hypothetical protein